MKDPFFETVCPHVEITQLSAPESAAVETGAMKVAGGD